MLPRLIHMIYFPWARQGKLKAMVLAAMGFASPPQLAESHPPAKEICAPQNYISTNIMFDEYIC